MVHAPGGPVERAMLVAMRGAGLVVVLAACKMNEHKAPPPAPVPKPIDAAIANPDAAPALVDLFRAVPTTVTVSSTVANKAILPRHLVDRDLGTAWNSATGELVGAWILITIPDGSMVQELRMTAGFTGKGPAGEDYFTMNPRIRSVTLEADGKPVGTALLDVARRDLQTLHVNAMHEVRITVAAIEPGTKPSWREVSMSELEAWGFAPAATGTHTPEVVVYSDRVFDPCAEIFKAREEFQQAHAHDHYTGPGAEDHAYPPTCEGLEVTGLETLPQPWAGGMGWCEIGDEIYGPKDCMLRFAHLGEVALIKVESEMAHGEIAVTKLAPQPDGLAITWQVGDRVLTAACTAHPLVCSEPK
jgi:hypothetical protein